MKTLRLLLFDKCNNRCAGCCNNDWDLKNLEQEKDFSQYDEIVLTGGEPMLRPIFVINTIKKIRQQTSVPIYMYTAKVDKPYEVLSMLHVLDGLTVTLHDAGYVEYRFKKFNDLLLKIRPVKSFRLNVFKGVDLTGVDLSMWRIKDNIVWIPNCPLPANETFKRL
jgi:MoaA/NifB/PqqE/SkfB family radical SAM enzyme